MFGDLASLYDGVVLDRSRHPRHQRRLDRADAVGQGDNPMCGDRIEVQLRYAADGGLQDVAFDARGCAVSIASADLMAEAVRHRHPDEVRALSARFHAMARSGRCPDCDGALAALRPFAGVHEYSSRVKCATLPWRALLAALDGAQETRS